MMQVPQDRGWLYATTTTAADGSFASPKPVPAGSRVVAQWAGTADGTLAGAGSTPLMVPRH
jgi:hypothetical protein